MKILVLFGSESDNYVYEPLVADLSEEHEVIMRVISAHRHPVELGEALENLDYDIIVAGAGLAAHLPGVVASKTLKPVFGVPVEAAFGGLDALLSIQQMPFGVPVASLGPSKVKCASSFLNYISKFKNPDQLKKINLVVNEKIRNDEYCVNEINRTLKYGEENNLKLEVVSKPNDDELNIILVHNESAIFHEKPYLYVPLMDKQTRGNFSKALDLFHWASKGGLWFGVNNTRNAVIWSQKFIKN